MRISRLVLLAGAALIPTLSGVFASAGAAPPGPVAVSERVAVAVPAVAASPPPSATPVPVSALAARAAARPVPDARSARTTTATSPTTSTTVTTMTADPSAPAASTSGTSGYPGTWGVYVPDFPGTLASVDSLQNAVGRKVNYVMWYVHWAGPYHQVNQGDLASVAGNGSTPVVTWMSDDPTGVTTITDSAIASGSYDQYIRSTANTLKSFGRPVLLRFDHEMNGNWYGWSPGQNGNTAAAYVAAWRHVYGLFAQVGATNVTFVWSPNVDYTGDTPMAGVYPGDAYVGMVALDGYNWGTVDGHTWQTPQQVFGPSLAEVAQITAKPLIIGEVGSTSVGGNKPAWITSFFSMLAANRSIHGFIWFDMNKETDWAISTPPSALSAFKAGLSGH